MEVNSSSSGLIGKYEYFMSMGDPRVADWPLMHSPIPTVAISTGYVIFSVLAPKILRGRKIPCHYPVLVYNFCLVLLNLYVAVELLYTTRGYSWICQEVDYSREEFPMRTAAAIWLFYFSKFIDMLDTVFFICKGNYRQVSFLHVYHHSTMFILWWIGTKYVPGGNSVPCSVINSVVHVIMYTYYFLAAFGPRFKKYLWWKRYLTQLQLAQFVFNMCNVIVAFYAGCNFPTWMYAAQIFYMTTFLILFGNFYRQNYLKKPAQATGKPLNKSELNNNADMKRKAE